MNSVMGSGRGYASVFVGIYAWAAALSFGIVVADIAYDAVLRSSGVDAAAVAQVQARIADSLIVTDGLTLLAAFVAIVAAWPRPNVRWLLIAAVATIAVPVGVLVAAGLLAQPLDASASPGFGASLRLFVFGLASVLAFTAFSKLRRAT